MNPVVKPAISPYGHVMGLLLFGWIRSRYDSWVRVLNRNPKNTCPFTKKVRTNEWHQVVEINKTFTRKADSGEH